MSNRTVLWVFLSVLTMGLLASGCATSKSASITSTLASSGFKIIPATTAEEQNQMKTLPAGKLSVVKRKGTVYYVYPDHTHGVLYVGKEAQYQAYQNELEGLELAAEDAKAARDSRGEALVNQQSEVLSGYDTPGWGGGWAGWAAW